MTLFPKGNLYSTRVAIRRISLAPTVLAFFIALGLLITPLYSAQADYLGAAEFIAPQDLQGIGGVSLDHFADETTGALVQKIPVTLPPGRGRATPELSLNYNSQSGNNLSSYGYGWSDSIPYIERSNKHGTEKLYDYNDFYSTLDGELLPETNGTTTSFRARVDNGSFNNYQFVSNSWLVTDKLGTTYKFGYATTTTRIYDTATSTTRIYRWLLQEVRDTNGNYVSYEYYRDGNQLYPKKVKYTGYDADPGLFEVEFLREARSDIATSSQSAFEVVSKYRINEIQVKINGSWVRKYELGYTAGDNGRRSLLSSVTETGKDESASTVTLPATTFTYQNSEGRQGWSATTTLYYLSPTTKYAVDNGQRIADINGDGLLDIIQAASNNHPLAGTPWEERVTKLSNGSQFATSSPYEAPSDIYFTKSNADDGSRLADVNGDGLTDILSAKYVNDSDPGYPDALSFNKTYINTGSGWTASTTWNSPLGFAGASIYQGTYFDPVISDINGDGLPDVLSAHVGTTSRAYINNGAGWTRNTDTWGTFIPGVYFDDYENLGHPQLIDVNGDHLPDVIKAVEFCHDDGPGGADVYCDDPVSKVYLNNGNGWNSTSTPWTVPFSFNTITLLYPSGDLGKDTDLGVRFTDLNGDGLVDVLKSAAGEAGPGDCDSCTAFINDGSGWYEDEDWKLPVNFIDHVNFGTYGYYQRDGDSRLLDIDGDGLSDVVRGSAVLYIPDNAGHLSDLLVQCRKSTGSFSTYEYKPASEYVVSTSTAANRFPFPLTTLYRTETNDGANATTTATYSYDSGSYYFNNPLDRRIGGFGTTTKTDALGNATLTFFHQGNGTSSPAVGEYADSYAKIGKSYRKEVRDSYGSLFDLGITWWNQFNQDNNRTFVSPLQAVSFAYDGGATHRDSATSFQYGTTTGNLISKTEWGEVTASSTVGSFTDVGTDKRIASTTYATGSSLNVFGLPLVETLVDYTDTKVREIRHYYDSLTLGSVDKGNETKTDSWKTGTSYASTTRAYNAYGLPSSSTDARGKTTSYTYDSLNLYIATSTNPLSQQTHFYYDYSLGKPKQTIDANGFTFTTTYDGLDRPTAEIQPDLVTGSAVNKKTYAYTDTVGLRKVVETNHLDGSNNFTLYTYLDGLNHVIQSRKEAEDTSKFSVKDFSYNKVGLLQRESLPYFSTGSGTTTATTTESLYTKYIYDPLQRITAVGTSVGTTTTQYTQGTTTVTDALGNDRLFVYDTFRRLIKVELPDVADEEESMIGGGGGGELSLAPSLLKYLAKAVEQLPLALAEVLDLPESLFEGSTSTPDTPNPETSPIPEEAATSSEAVPEQGDEVSSDTGQSEIPVTVPVTGIEASLTEKTQEEKIAIKSELLAEVGPVPRTAREQYDIEIISIEPIEGGIQLFARAWNKDGQQIGFGTDGSVDIERFRIFNPPVLVADENGTIKRQVTDPRTEKTVGEHTFREDPKEALLQLLEHTISVKTQRFGSEKIASGKVGNTTDTYYPSAGTSAPVDGLVYRDIYPSHDTFSNVRSGSGTAASNSGDDSYMAAVWSSNTSNEYSSIMRSIFGFNTSPIGTDNVSSATFSVYGVARQSTLGGSVVLDRRVPASSSALVTSDFNIAGWDGVEQATGRIAVSSFSTSGYNNFTLNSTGINNISTSGNSWYGLRISNDFDNSAPTWSADTASWVDGYFADQTGTANDPTLILEHSAAGPTGPIESEEGPNITAYLYDAADNLIKIIDANCNIRNFTYDGLARRTAAEDLHAPADGTYGTWGYAYDDAGNLASTTDPKGQVVEYTYDDLNRALTENYTGLGGTEIEYAYDICTNGVGRLCIATSTGAISRFTYNALGLTATTTQTIGGTSYATGYSYDRQSNLTGIVYPDNFQVSYGYNTAGLLESIQKKEIGGAFADVVSDFDYGPHEKVTFKVFANGVKSEYTYKTQELYRLGNIHTMASSTWSGSGGGFALLNNSWGNFAKAPEGFFTFKSFFGRLFAIDDSTPTAPDPLPPLPDVPLVDTDTASTSVEEPVVEHTPEAASTTPETGEIIAPEIEETLPQTEVEETSVAPVNASKTNIRVQLLGKSSQQKADLKGREIASYIEAHNDGVIQRENYAFEIVSIEPIAGGVQTFVRVWDKNGQQIGFGKDGSVDIERFRIFNPPILVPDSGGDVVRKSTNKDPKGDLIERTRVLREDPQEALLQVIEQSLGVMRNIHGPENIVPEKVGRTTSTFYPSAGTSAPVDGLLYRDIYPSEDTFASVRSGSGTSASNSGDDSYMAAIWSTGTSNKYGNIMRSIFGFNTSPIGTDEISSATFSVYGVAKQDTLGGSVVLDRNIPASNSVLVTSDFNIAGWASTEQASNRIAVSSFSTSGYNNFDLNGTGIGNISTVGYSWYGLRVSSDFDNSAPTWSSNTASWIDGYYADQSGTTNDPKLVVESSPAAPPSSDPDGLQDLTYTYDLVGNITQIQDTSDTDTYHTAEFTYDNLYRLTSATTTVASTTPYYQRYTYNRLGNFNYKSDIGNYYYTGTTTSSYANPHAPTSINGASVVYDNNGNQTNFASTTNLFDYRNRLIATYASSSPSQFNVYDHTMQRIAYGNGVATTSEPTKYFNKLITNYATSTATTTRHIFTPGGESVATVTGNGISTTTQYIHVDHLGGTNVVTNEEGLTVEVEDRYPFGGPRISETYGIEKTKRQFAGTERDFESNMDYMINRYYEYDRGQFISIDPVFWEIGITPDGKKVLLDPQLQHAYSYARNNPLTNKDPEGRLSINNLVQIIQGLGTANDSVNIYGSGQEFRGVNMNGFNFSGSIPSVTNFGLSTVSLFAPPAISVPWFLGEGFMYLGEISGANKPEVRDRVNKIVQTAQQSRSPIQQYTSGFQTPSLMNSFNNIFSGGTTPLNIGNSGGGKFIGTYDFGGGIKYDYGRGQWITNPSSSGSGSGTGNSSNSGRSQTMIGGSQR